MCLLGQHLKRAWSFQLQRGGGGMSPRVIFPMSLHTSCDQTLTVGSVLPPGWHELAQQPVYLGRAEGWMAGRGDRANTCSHATSSCHIQLGSADWARLASAPCKRTADLAATPAKQQRHSTRAHTRTHPRKHTQIHLRHSYYLAKP